MGKRSKKAQRTQTFGTILLLLTYIAIGFMVSHVAQHNFGLELLPAAGIAFGISFLIFGISEILDRKLGWSEKTNKASEPLTAPEFIKANPTLGNRAMVREFVEQGGTIEDIKAELAK